MWKTNFCALGGIWTHDLLHSRQASCRWTAGASRWRANGTRAKGRFILCRRPRAAGRTELSVFRLSLCFHWWRGGVPGGFACVLRVCVNMDCDCACARMGGCAACALQFACCGLRHTLPQAAALKLQRAGSIVFLVCVRAIAFMFRHTQRTSEFAGNSVEILVGTEKVEICWTWCGPRPEARGSRPVACGKVWTGLYAYDQPLEGI